jgi:hypothetical protein
MQIPSCNEYLVTFCLQPLRNREQPGQMPEVQSQLPSKQYSHVWLANWNGCSARLDELFLWTSIWLELFIFP